VKDEDRNSKVWNKRRWKLLTVTDSAKELLKETLLGNTDDPEIGIRLRVGPGKLGLVLGREAEGDQIVEHDGLKVLLVGQELATILELVTLNVRDTPDGPELILVRR